MKKSVAQMYNFFREKSPLFAVFHENDHNELMMSSTCIIHENKLYLMKKCVVQMYNFFRKKSPLFAVFQCYFDANVRK